MTNTTSPRARSYYHGLLFVTAIAPLGCQQPAHDLGQTRDELATPPPAEEGLDAAELASDFAGVWEGEMEDALGVNADGSSPTVYAFPSGSTLLRLELAPNDFGVSGTLTFGQGELLPVAVDPNLGYPPDPSFEFTTVFSAENVPPFEGFSYAVTNDIDVHDLDMLGRTGYDTTMDFDANRPAIDGKLDLSFDLDEPFRPWCELQTDDLCNSIDSVGWSGDDLSVCFVSHNEQSHEVDCQKAVLCAGQHCRNEHRTELALRFTGDGLTGAFFDLPLVNERGFSTRSGTVRFRRVAVNAAISQ